MTADLSAIAAALRALPGVTEADVDPDDAGGVSALRLELDAGVDGLAVAGAASRLVLERFGAAVDTDHVHVIDAAQAPTASAPPVTLPQQRVVRPEIVRTDLVTTGLEVTATVVLSSSSRAATGDSRGAATQSGGHRAVAQATLRAVERLARDQARIELDHLDVAQNGRDRTVLVSLTLVSARGAERLTGAALVREDEARAVVRATLDALNRRLEALLA